MSYLLKSITLLVTVGALVAIHGAREARSKEEASPAVAAAPVETTTRLWGKLRCAVALAQVVADTPGSAGQVSLIVVSSTGLAIALPKGERHLARTLEMELEACILLADPPLDVGSLAAIKGSAMGVERVETDESWSVSIGAFAAGMIRKRSPHTIDPVEGEVALREYARRHATHSALASGAFKDSVVFGYLHAEDGTGEAWITGTFNDLTGVDVFVQNIAYSPRLSLRSMSLSSEVGEVFELGFVRGGPKAPRVKAIVSLEVRR